MKIKKNKIVKFNGRNDEKVVNLISIVSGKGRNDATLNNRRIIVHCSTTKFKTFNF